MASSSTQLVTTPTPTASTQALQLQPLRLAGTWLITGTPRVDKRGYFMRTWDDEILQAHGLRTCWVQENEAYSRGQGTLRGLHFQRPPSAETKLVRVAVGTVLDVFV